MFQMDNVILYKKQLEKDVMGQFLINICLCFLYEMNLIVECSVLFVDQELTHIHMNFFPSFLKMP